MTAGDWKALNRSAVACLIALPALELAATAQAKNGNNTITTLGTCWAVTVQGSSNTVVADNAINDITVYGSDQAVIYKSGDPVVWDRGRALGMTNRIDRVPA